MNEPTPRQKEIILHLSNGMSHKQIGHHMKISPETARKQIVFAFDRTGAANGSALVAMALRKGWIK